ncbi:MAG: hypothetical protein Q8S02_10690 [Hydrogenophaga sp.]|nr:hypothetical protein [Hydrogenophaga sp.]
MNMAWLDHITWKWLLLLAVWMVVAPITPEPHLVEKVRMLSQGTLTKPIDIFDLFFHLAPLALVALKYRHEKRRPKA